MKHFVDLEKAAFHAWPATEEQRYDGVVLRAANGYTKRANSANLLTQQANKFEETLAQCEAFFHARQLPTIFRIPSFTNNQSFDAFLAAHGYTAKDKSLVMTRPLTLIESEAKKTQTLPLSSWLAAFGWLNNSTEQSNAKHLNILEQISSSVLPSVLEKEKQTVCCGLGVLEAENFGLFDIVTKQNSRKKGYATQLICSMLHWASQQGATTAYLQVVAGNHAAIKLYEKLGFRVAYHYWYRIKD